MATELAVPPSRRTAPDPLQHAWQVPLFLLGVSVFVSAWQGWLPLGTPDPAADYSRDLQQLQLIYDKVSPDREELKELLAAAVSKVDSFPQQAGVGRFTIGSGYSRLAELTPNLDEAHGYWALAKQHLELLRPEELKDPGDPPRLAFRLAKARAAVGWPESTSVADLRLQMQVLGTPPFKEEPGDSGRLQADLAMRLTPPDLHTAGEALRRYVISSGIATPAASLSRAKYQLGEICFRRGELKDARKWLEQVGTEAQEVLAPSRFLLARVRMKEEDWLGSARDLETLRAIPGLPQPLKLTAAYHLAFCKLKTNEPAVAAKLFEEAIQAEHPEGIAASVRLAELNLQSTDATKHSSAADLLAVAVRGIKEPKEFRNPLVRPNEVIAVFELALSTLLADGAYESVLKVVDSYKVLAAPGREREKRAETLAAWASTLQKSGGDFKPKALAAAEEYKSQVAFQPDMSAQAAMLRRVAVLYKQGGDLDASIATLRDATKLPNIPDGALSPIWAELADSLIATNRSEKEVIDAFNQSMASAGTATRYRLARQFAESRRAELAPLSRELFRQIAQQESVGPAEQEFHERAQVELAHDYIRAGNFSEAEIWLRKQLGSYSTGAEAPLGRLLLGVCLIQRTTGPAASGLDAPTVAKLRDEALKLFKQTVAESDAKLKRDGKLNERDAWLRLQAALRVLQTYQQLQKPNDLLAEAAELRRQYQGTVEELIVLSLMYHAFRQKNETGRAAEAREQMKELFDRLPTSVFTAEKGEYSRTYWEQTWFTPDPKQ